MLVEHFFIDKFLCLSSDDLEPFHGLFNDGPRLAQIHTKHEYGTAKIIAGDQRSNYLSQTFGCNFVAMDDLFLDGKFFDVTVLDQVRSLGLEIQI